MVDAGNKQDPVAEAAHHRSLGPAQVWPQQAKQTTDPTGAHDFAQRHQHKQPQCRAAEVGHQTEGIQHQQQRHGQHSTHQEHQAPMLLHKVCGGLQVHWELDAVDTFQTNQHINVVMRWCGQDPNWKQVTAQSPLLHIRPGLPSLFALPNPNLTVVLCGRLQAQPQRLRRVWIGGQPKASPVRWCIGCSQHLVGLLQSDGVVRLGACPCLFWCELRRLIDHDAQLRPKHGCILKGVGASQSTAKQRQPQQAALKHQTSHAAETSANKSNWLACGFSHPVVCRFASCGCAPWPR